MADENDAGAAYLASLRKSVTSSAAGAAPARAPVPRSAENQSGDAVPTTRANTGIIEKRKSPRYKCAGSARVQEVGSTVSTWATFSDISLHGCYVETAVPLRVNATLSLKLEVNGFRVETGGQVRVSYPGLGMGVSFTKMSEEDRERLRELMRLISPPSVILSQRIAANAPSAPPRVFPLWRTRAQRCKPCKTSSGTATSWAGRSFSRFCARATSTCHFSVLGPVTLVLALAPPFAWKFA